MSPGPAAARSNREKLARFGWALLIAAALYVCYFSHLGAIGFVGPDEPRYAWVARAMVESGDWVTPRLYDKPWFEKPPLLYWGAALSFELFGVSEAAARLPSAISALLATLALAWLAWRVYGAETARWLLLLLPTTVGMIGFSHAAATDMPFSAMLTIAMVAAAVVVGLVPHATHVIPSGEPATFVGSERGISVSRAGNSPQSTPWLALTAFGVFLGAAVLAKGPAGIILCGGTVFFWALFTRRWRDAFRLLHPVALAAFCLTALPWYILCAHRNPEFLRVFLIEHNFQRYLTPEFHHIQPFWFFLPVIVVGLLPWISLFLALVRDMGRALRHGSWRTSQSLLFAVWAGVTFVFFSLSKSKLPGYVLPVIPALILPLSQSVSLRVRGIVGGARMIGVSVGISLLGLAIVSAVKLQPMWSRSEGAPRPLADHVPPGPWRGLVVLWVMAALISLGCGLFRRARVPIVVSVSALLAAISFGLTGDAARTVDYNISAGPAAWESKGIVTAYSDKTLYVYKLSRSSQYSLNFYFHRELPELPVGGAQHAYIFTRPGSISALREIGIRCPLYWNFPKFTVCENSTNLAPSSR